MKEGLCHAVNPIMRVDVGGLMHIKVPALVIILKIRSRYSGLSIIVFPIDLHVKIVFILQRISSP